MATILQQKEMNDHFLSSYLILNIINKNIYLLLNFSCNYLSVPTATCSFSSTSVSYAHCSPTSPAIPPLPLSISSPSPPSLSTPSIFLLFPLNNSHLLPSIPLTELKFLRLLFGFFPFFNQHIQHLFSPLPSHLVLLAFEQVFHYACVVDLRSLQ